MLTAQVTRGGQPAAGISVTLLKRTLGRPGWRSAGSGTTSATGQVVVDVADLAANAAFRFMNAQGRTSARVVVKVVPAVTLQLETGPRRRVDALAVSSPFAQPRNFVMLQVQSGGNWVTIRTRRLGAGLERTCLVRARRLEGRTVRAVLPATRRHAASSSNQVQVPA